MIGIVKVEPGNISARFHCTWHTFYFWDHFLCQFWQTLHYSKQNIQKEEQRLFMWLWLYEITLPQGMLYSKVSTEHYFDLWFIYVYFSNDSVVIQVMFNRCTARSIYLSSGCMDIILKTLILLMVKEANTDSMKVFMYHHYFHICKQWNILNMCTWWLIYESILVLG